MKQAKMISCFVAVATLIAGETAFAEPAAADAVARTRSEEISRAEWLETAGDIITASGAVIASAGVIAIFSELLSRFGDRHPLFSCDPQYWHCPWQPPRPDASGPIIGGAIAIGAGLSTALVGLVLSDSAGTLRIQAGHLPGGAAASVTLAF